MEMWRDPHTCGILSREWIITQFWIQPWGPDLMITSRYELHCSKVGLGLNFPGDHAVRFILLKHVWALKLSLRPVHRFGRFHLSLHCRGFTYWNNGKKPARLTVITSVGIWPWSRAWCLLPVIDKVPSSTPPRRSVAGAGVHCAV